MIKDYSRTELINGIDEWIVGKNAERNRLILKWKLIDGLSHMEIMKRLSSDEFPESYHLEVRQIQREIRRCETVLFRHI